MQERVKGKEERGKVCWKEGIEGKVGRIGERKGKREIGTFVGRRVLKEG